MNYTSDTNLLHEKTRMLLNNVQPHVSQAICLVGPEGSGKLYTARLLAKSLIANKDNNQHLIIELNTDISTQHGISEIREITKILKIKNNSSKNNNRIVIIKDIQSMSEEAQSSLLKTLEEPPAGTLFILTLQDKDQVMPTIVSRSKIIPIYPLTNMDTACLHPKYEADIIRSALLASDGRAGLLCSLISKSDNEIKQSLELAKGIIRKPTHQRIVIIEELLKNPRLDLILFFLQRVVHFQIVSNEFRDKKIILSYKQLLDTRTSFVSNVNKKLLLTQLLLNV
jgi:DNA polymerase III delta prime subunit